ncbi:MAG: TRC40/GET3/ArsA family transport-energizing ATPase [Myxococcota bacterium]
MRLVLYTGKGGVGKTTSAAATAAHAATRGLRTLVASADAAHSLADVLAEPLGAEPRALTGTLDAVEVDARAETERQWGRVRDYLAQLFRHQGIEDIVADELALLPGAEELTTLLAVERWAREARYDLVVVDCAPTGSALRLLSVPEVARSGLRLLLRVQRTLASVVTPVAQSVLAVPLPGSAVFRDAEELIYRRLAGLRELVGSAAASVRLVVTPERMVIDEALRARTDLALFELACDAVVMNRLLPAEAAEEPHFRDWVRLQAERLAEVEQRFAPLPVLRASLREDEVIGVEALARHGAELFDGREPEAVLSRRRGLRFVRTAAGVRATLPLPEARADDLAVAKLENELSITSGGQRRALPLPRHVAPLALARARLERGTLTLDFAPEGP